jgi:hypothetical protein
VKNLAIPLALLAAMAWAQSMTDDPPQSNPDAAGAKPQLVAENEHYSVRILDLTGATRMALPQRTNDTIVVVLGQGLSLISDRLESPVALADGDVRFLERIKHPVLVHSGEVASQVLLVEIKHHWNAEIDICSEPGRCNRAIRAGGIEIGQSTRLFTNGFITAYRDHIARGGTLDTSYYTKGRSPHLLLIALDDLQADFEETHREMKRGEVFLSDAGQLEVDAGLHEARWIVVRVETPKP